MYQVLPLLLAAPLQTSAAAAPTPNPRYETSAIVRSGSDLFLVSDELPRSYLTYSVTHLDWQSNCARLSPKYLAEVALGKDLALDLEGIALLPNGHPVLLSERLRALIGPEGLVVQYDDPLTEFGNAGMEGVAIRAVEGNTLEVAVLWEGGYLDSDRIPPVVQPVLDRSQAQPAVSPFILADTVDGSKIPLDYKSRKTKKARALDVPVPPGDPPTAQRFRAPDLVWQHPRPPGPSGALPGFIVLLNSRAAVAEKGLTTEQEARRSLLWLQRFSADGKRVGEPIDIDKAVPPEFRSLNWEGLGWWEDGVTLVVIDDAGALRRAHEPPAVCLISLPPDWRTSTSVPSK